MIQSRPNEAHAFPKDAEVMTNDQLLKQVTRFYLESHDFNGLPFSSFGCSSEEMKRAVSELVKESRVTLNFGDIHPNPHIKAFESEPIKNQLNKMETSLADACLYPSKTVLAESVDRSKYEGCPFSLLLALGEPQLSFRSFDLSILEVYRNDPRYVYNSDDISGHITVISQHYKSPDMRQVDQVHLETFGFSFDSKLKRAVAVFFTLSSRSEPRASADVEDKDAIG